MCVYHTMPEGPCACTECREDLRASILNRDNLVDRIRRAGLRVDHDGQVVTATFRERHTQARHSRDALLELACQLDMAASEIRRIVGEEY